MRKLLLYPIGILYGFIIRIRNWLYDMNVFKSKTFEMPVISIGNLSTGGTGKTPHTEYLIRLLSEKFRIATLSRGYGRKTRGFLTGNSFSASHEIGDEPLQFAHKYKDIRIAVDEDRVHGIEELAYRYPDLDVVLLDDAFQHRAVKPGLSILLTDFYNLYPEDFLLPAGNLREPRSAAARADIIIVTKTRKVFSPITSQRLIESLKPLPHQKLYQSYIKYGQITSVHKKECSVKMDKKVNTIFMFSGIANPYPMEDHLKSLCIELVSMTFPDHHQYTAKDVAKIKQAWDDIYTRNKLMVTTEKDFMRLKDPRIWNLVVNLPVHYLPIEIDFHNGDKQDFENQILDYVKRSKRNHGIYPVKNQRQA